MRVASTLLALLVASVAFADTCPHCAGTLPAPVVVTRWHYVPAPVSLSGARELDPVKCPCATLAGTCPCSAPRETPPIVAPIVYRPAPRFLRGRCR